METRRYSRHKYPPVNNVMVSLFLAGGSGGDSAVQQAQVSSSKPAILADDVLGPLLLEVSIH